MKIKIFMVILVILLMVGSVLAEVKKPKKWYRKPFTKIWNALLNLQKQIDDIQLIPGPEGEQGQEGPPGADGEKGNTGECDCDINLKEFKSLVERVEVLETENESDNIIKEGDIIITEFMYNPDSVSDSDGEWFAIYNQQSFDISIKGLSISDYGNNYFVIDEDLVILSGGHLVLCKNSDMGTNGGIECDLEYDDITLSNSNDEIVLMMEDNIIDEVLYDDWSHCDNAGYSAQLSSNLYDNKENDNGESWCNIGFGTPGEVNGLC